MTCLKRLVHKRNELQSRVFSQNVAPIRIFYDTSRISTNTSKDAGSVCYTSADTVNAEVLSNCKLSYMFFQIIYQPISYNCTSDDVLTTAKVNFILDYLIPYAKSKIESSLSVVQMNKSLSIT
jgi:hypothetical protein